ncbi:hypothetical protein KT71_11074 [Congregibacter litoralis KT71]|uniref:DUF3348 domain-containing protein n=2 Tax=Congregibacter TaxID=393661 RepID=A4AAW6_9GAMM|nr:hypothetical protein KT71_11074 [Congregibacter litoralis KT71]
MLRNMSRTTISAVGQAPLVRLLADLGLASSKPGKRVFATRLADLIDISDAITLSDFFSKLDRVSTSQQVESAEGVDSVFDQHRAAMRGSIDASFATDEDELSLAGRNVFPLPTVSAENVSAAETIARYERFYSLHQSELERRVAQLRKVLLERMRSQSDALAQVAALEIAMGPIFVKYTRQCFATLPGLVAQRFEYLRLHQHQQDWVAKEPASWLREDGWLARFHDEVKQLLHAELTLRLQPLDGMLSLLSPNDSLEKHS